jgi:hypothetical protein
VELAAVDPGPFDRCITFEVYPTGSATPVTVEQTVTFSSGLGMATFDLPCDDYDCITARDALRTLARTDSDDFAIVGSVYEANFTGTGSLDDDALVGGNANGDGYIDILDFGAYIVQYGLTLGADTPCGTPAPHTDFDGDGTVGIDDFTFIQIGFFDESDVACGAGPILADGSRLRGQLAGGRPLGEEPTLIGPVSSISVAELRRRGMGELAEADLNADGMLDQNDMAAFVLGARPAHVFDVNGDRWIDAQDLDLALSGYSQGNLSYDLDGDGSVTLNDVVLVLQRVGTAMDDR